jgi:hypothetical protein
MALGVYAAYFGFCSVVAAVNLAARRAGIRPGLVAGANLLCALVAAPCMMLVSEPAEWLSDFRKAYYAAGRLVLEDPCAMYGADELRFVNLPVLALPFVPLAALPLRPAKWVFTLAGLAAIAAAWALLVLFTQVRGWRRAALTAMFVLNGPLYYSLREGNLTHFLLPVLVATLFCLERRRDFGVGALLALAGLVKPPLLLLAGWCVWRRGWRAAAGGAAVLALAVGTSLILFGPAVHRVWCERCIGPYAARPMNASNVQSASGFLARLFVEGGRDGDWRPVEVGRTYTACHLLLLAILAGGPLLACRRPPGKDRVGADQLEFCAVLCLALVVSPVSWTHYYLLLLVPCALLLGGRPSLPGRAWGTAFVLSVALLSPPVTMLPEANWGVRQFASHCFAGGALLLVVLSAARWQASGDGVLALRLYRPATDLASRIGEDPAARGGKRPEGTDREIAA